MSPVSRHFGDKGHQKRSRKVFLTNVMTRATVSFPLLVRMNRSRVHLTRSENTPSRRTGEHFFGPHQSSSMAFTPTQTTTKGVNAPGFGSIRQNKVSVNPPSASMCILNDIHLYKRDVCTAEYTAHIARRPLCILLMTHGVTESCLQIFSTV